MSKEQVADLFVGKTQQLGGASAALVDQAELKKTFTLKATGNAAQIKATWAKAVVHRQGNAQRSQRQRRGESSSPATRRRLAISTRPQWMAA